MPRLWNDTIEARRNAVRAALLDAVTGTLAESGPAAVTLAHVATRGGGRGRCDSMTA